LAQKRAEGWQREVTLGKSGERQAARVTDATASAISPR
jgi:hypothetical protein